jgi:hypothetical protein
MLQAGLDLSRRKIDARVLAILSHRDLVPEIWPPDPGVRRERELARFRMHLVKHRSMRKHRIHATLISFGHPCPSATCSASPAASSWTASRCRSRGAVDASLRLIDDPDRQIDAINRELRASGADHPKRIADNDDAHATRCRPTHAHGNVLAAAAFRPEAAVESRVEPRAGECRCHRGGVVVEVRASLPVGSESLADFVGTPDSSESRSGVPVGIALRAQRVEALADVLRTLPASDTSWTSPGSVDTGCLGGLGLFCLDSLPICRCEPRSGESRPAVAERAVLELRG